MAEDFSWENTAQKPGTNAPSFSVSEISNSLRRVVEDNFGHVRIRGEISGYRGVHSSGHAYFALKDEKARIDAVIWRSAVGKLKFAPEEGMEVIATGKLSTYAGSSRYQIIIEKLEPAGIGALMALLEERKKKFIAEGLFASERKKKLPAMPKVLGVITSETGAVIHDILHRIQDRFPLHVLVWPVRVQGETCAQEVEAAILGFNNQTLLPNMPKIDVLIVARGGGSLEDLWGFNEENIIRAVAQSNIPVISAIGHETDWTLIDYVADVRAPTPTGAAELAVPVRAEIHSKLNMMHNRLESAFKRFLLLKWQDVDNLTRELPLPQQFLSAKRHQYHQSAQSFRHLWQQTRTHKYTLWRHQAQRLQPYLIGRFIERNKLHLFSLKRRMDQACQHHLTRYHQLIAYKTRPLSPNLIQDFIKNYRFTLKASMQQIEHFTQQKFALRQQKYKNIEPRLSHKVAHNILEKNRSHIKNMAQIMEREFIRHLLLHRQSFYHLTRLLSGLSYEKILERGFTLILDEEGHVLKRKESLEDKKTFFVQFLDGKQAAKVLNEKALNEEEGTQTVKASRKKQGGEEKPDMSVQKSLEGKNSQRSLF